jgi:hypothetical protein
VCASIWGMDMKKSLLSAISTATMLSFSAPACADVLTFEMQTQSPRKVFIAFFSESRNQAWPGGNNAYVISRHRPPLVYNYPLQCRRGEKICFGAWEPKNSNSTWGVGKDGRHSCSDCCFIRQNGSTGLQILDD